MKRENYRVVIKDIDFNISVPSRGEFSSTLQYLREKEEKYLNEMIQNLNTIHQTSYSNNFWGKTLGAGFRRFVHISYEAYTDHKKRFNDEYSFLKMSQSTYGTPNDFDDFRDYFTNKESGFYQMFSLYLDCFYKESQQIEVYNAPAKQEVEGSSFADTVKRKFKNVTFDKLINLILTYVYKLKQPKVLIMGSYFKPSYLKKLLFKSFGNIQQASFNPSIYTNTFDKNMRIEFQNMFSNTEDDFDKFFYFTLFYNFPSMLLEDFNGNYDQCKNFISDYRNLEYIISEDWIGSSKRSLLLAVAKEEKNIKHIYNEHNAMFHQVLGGSTELEKNLVDVYYTLGWNGKGYLPGASLYNYNDENEYTQKNQILFISSETFVRRSEWNGAYSSSQENGHCHVKFDYEFFEKLHYSTIKNLLYRSYPVKVNWNSFAKEKALSCFLKDVKKDDFKYSSKAMMKMSKLVIIDYLATSYLESLIMNIPTIVFWNQDTYYLADEYSNFFDDLVTCGICQTSPEKAAEFVNELVENNSIEDWWYSEKTQSARKAFLDENIGDPKDAIDFYLSLAKE